MPRVVRDADDDHRHQTPTHPSLLLLARFKAQKKTAVSRRTERVPTRPNRSLDRQRNANSRIYIYIVLIPEFEFESSHTKNSLSRSSFFSRRIERDDAFFFFFFFFSRGVFFFGVSQRWCWPSKGGVIAERENSRDRERERDS